MNSLECEKQVIKAISYHLLPQKRKSQCFLPPRKSTAGLMYAVGGMDSNKGWSTVDENYQGFIVT